MHAERHRRATRARGVGFTLIELVITLSLIGVMLALGMPAFVDWVRNARIRTVAETLQGGLRTAQAEALRRNRQVVMSFTNATPAPDITAVAGGRNWALQTVAQFGETAEYITGGSFADTASTVTISAVPSTSQTAICFNATGRLVTNASGTGISGASCTAAVTTFTVTSPSAARPLRVVLQLGGQVRMCDPNRPALSSTSPDGCP